jgi:capsule synthesis protein PGA_cap
VPESIRDHNEEAHAARLARRARARRWLRCSRLAAAGVLLALGAAGGVFAATSLTGQDGGPVATDSGSAPASTQTVSSEFSIAATGDVTLGMAGVYPPGGAARLLLGVRGFLRGDVVLGNLETVLGDVGVAAGAGKCAGATPGTCFAFIAPAADAFGLRKNGYTILNVANNHAEDHGATGEAMTERALARAHLRWTGRPGQIAYLRVRGLNVAVLGFAPYRWAQNMLDVHAAEALVRRAAARAQVVVVTMHAGAEGHEHEHVRRGGEIFLGEPRGDPIRFAHAVIDAGADIVIGHGPHVLRALQWYRGHLIAYSLGNLSGYRTLNVSGDSGVGGILQVRLDGNGRLLAGRVVSVRLVGTGTPTGDAGNAAASLLRRLSRSDFPRSAPTIARNGRITPLVSQTAG